MVQLFKKSANGPLVAAMIISLTAIITHGIMIPRLGYYYDDWYMLWSGASRGVDSLVSLFSVDRPFMGVIYTVFYRLFRDSIPAWHIGALVMRILGAFAFYWILNLAWPSLKKWSVLAAMLFVVYPGFLAQPNAATKINHLLGYGAALFSIALTLKAILSARVTQRIIYTALSMLLLALYLWIYEYMIGLEVMRLALMGWVLWHGRRHKLFPLVKKAVLEYLPYVAVIGVFLFWRVFIFRSTRPATDLSGLVSDYLRQPVEMVLRLIFQVGKDFLSASVFAWFVQPYYLLTRSVYGQILLALLFAAVVVALAILYARATGSAEPEQPAHDGKPGDLLPGEVSPYLLLGLGALITLGAVFPVVLSDRYLDLMNAYKGYALHPSAGVMIMVLGLVLMLRPHFARVLLITLLALSVSTQILNIQNWARFWDLQRGLWWQMTWRAPDLQDNTLLMVYLPDGYPLQQDYEIWGPANLIYSQAPLSLPRIQAEVLNKETLLYVDQGKLTDPWVRDIFMPHYYSNLLLVSQPSQSSCVHVIDGSMQVYSPSERVIVEKAGWHSDVQFIDTTAQPPVPPADVFGQEPEHGWCYYYQKASLARQEGNWTRISELYDAASAEGLAPNDPSEFFVFFEGLVNAGRTEDAQELVAEIKASEALRFSLCDLMTEASSYPGTGYRREEIISMVCQ